MNFSTIKVPRTLIGLAFGLIGFQIRIENLSIPCDEFFPNSESLFKSNRWFDSKFYLTRQDEKLVCLKDFCVILPIIISATNRFIVVIYINLWIVLANL